MNRQLTQSLLAAGFLVPSIACCQAAPPGIAPIPSTELIEFIENNPQLFPEEYKQRLYRGFATIVAQAKAVSVLPYVFNGEQVIIPRTASPVRTHDPECGANDPGLDKDVETLRDVMTGISVITAEAAPIIAGAAEVVAQAIDLFGQKRQNFSSCKMVCTVVPATITAQTIQQFGFVTLNHETPADRRYGGSLQVKAPGDGSPDLGWAAWSSPVISVSPIPQAQSPLRVAPKHASKPKALDGDRCPSTLVCGRFKNWSSSWPRQASLSVTLGHGPWTNSACLDMSTLSQTVKETVLVPALRQADIDLKSLLDLYRQSMAAPRR